MENNLEKLRFNNAKNRVEELRTFYIMLSGYFLMMPFLIFINMKTNPELHWFWFPLIGCGISILGYTLYVFVGRNWEEKQIQKILEKENQL